MFLYEHFRAMMELIIPHNINIQEIISICIFFYSVSSVIPYYGGSNANKIKKEITDKWIETGG